MGGIAKRAGMGGRLGFANFGAGYRTRVGFVSHLCSLFHC
jgi:hypothetical protein